MGSLEEVLRAIKDITGGKGQIKMVEQKDVELTSSHKYIKNTSTRRTILTEYLLNAGRSHKAKITRKITM